jgi:hypothetical protein
MTSNPKSIRLCLLFAFASSTVSAHHNSGAVFDMENEVTIEGVVTKYEFRNPHVYIYVDAEDSNGNIVNFRIEAGPFGILRRFGWSRDTLSEGDKLTVTGNPARNPERHALFLKSGKSDERDLPPFRGDQARETLTTYSATTGSKAEGLNGTWETVLDIAQLGLLEAPEDLPLTPKGVAAVESFDDNTMHPGLDCIPITAPGLMLIPDTKSIEIGDEFIRIRAEFDNAERVVQMSDSSKNNSRSAIQGESIGRWEDDVLVIETSAFPDHRSGNGYGLPSGSQKSLNERLQLNPDAKSLTYHFELNDPEFLAEPISGEVQWAYRPDVEYLGLECDPENSRRYLDEQ